jgi:hypothetical protein
MIIADPEHKLEIWKPKLVARLAAKASILLLDVVPENGPVLRLRIRDPVPFLTPGSGMNIPYHISESL